MGLAMEAYERKYSVIAFGKIMEIPFEDGMKELLRVSGLDKAGLLYDFYREKFSGIANRENGVLYRTAREEPARESKRMLVALLGFVVDSFYSHKLQTPQKIILENSYCDSTYSLTSLYFWDHTPIYDWDEQFSGYAEKLEDYKDWTGEGVFSEEEVKEQRNELFRWSLKHEYGEEFRKKYWARLRELLESMKANSSLVELIERNGELRRIVLGTTYYPKNLRESLNGEFESFEKSLGESKDPAQDFTVKVLKVILDDYHGDGILSNTWEVQCAFLNSYWTELEKLVKGTQAKQVVNLLNKEMMGLLTEIKSQIPEGEEY